MPRLVSAGFAWRPVTSVAWQMIGARCAVTGNLPLPLSSKFGSGLRVERLQSPWRFTQTIWGRVRSTTFRPLKVQCAQAETARFHNCRISKRLRIEFCILFLRSAHTRNRTEIRTNPSSEKSNELWQNFRAAGKITLCHRARLRRLRKLQNEPSAAPKKSPVSFREFFAIEWHKLNKIKEIRAKYHVSRSLFLRLIVGLSVRGRSSCGTALSASRPQIQFWSRVRSRQSQSWLKSARLHPVPTPSSAPTSSWCAHCH